MTHNSEIKAIHPRRICVFSAVPLAQLIIRLIACDSRFAHISVYHKIHLTNIKISENAFHLFSLIHLCGDILSEWHIHMHTHTLARKPQQIPETLILLIKTFLLR